MKRPVKSTKSQTDNKLERTATQPKPSAPTPEQIRRRAQEIFEARGSAPGRELDDWLRAEDELKTEVGRRQENSNE